MRWEAKVKMEKGRRVGRRQGRTKGKKGTSKDPRWLTELKMESQNRELTATGRQNKAHKGDD